MEKILKQVLSLIPFLFVILIIVKVTPFLVSKYKNKVVTKEEYSNKERTPVQTFPTEEINAGTSSLESANHNKEERVVPDKEEKHLFTYIEIINSCGPYYKGVCVNVRASSTTQSKAITKLRNGIILKVKEKVVHGDETWYKITFEDEWLRHKERITTDWYVSGEFVRAFEDQGIKQLKPNEATSTKYIIVDRTHQKLYAYDGKTLFMKEKISTGIEMTPTPRGVFTIYKKTPSRYMQGPILGVSDQIYDLPGVPWNLYFSNEGAVIHGAYWHDKFGQKWSHGCVNLSQEAAEKLYTWADTGVKVIVRD